MQLFGSDALYTWRRVQAVSVWGGVCSEPWLASSAEVSGRALQIRSVLLADTYRCL